MRAADGQDVDIPLPVMSYVVVPPTAEIGLVYHGAYLTRAQKRSVLKYGIKRKYGGRHRVFCDAPWPFGHNEWPAGLTGFGSFFKCPKSGRWICLNRPYGHQADK